MNTIEESSFETNWDAKAGATNNGAVGTSSNNTEHQQEQQQQKKQTEPEAPATNGTAPPYTNISLNGSSSCNSSSEELKIIGHLKSIEKINEKRRIFLTNTITESATETAIETATTTATATSASTSTTINGKVEQNEKQETYNEEHTHKREERVDTTAAPADVTPTSSHYATPSPLRSPLTPPPKPPMLSRTRSFGVGDNTTPTVTSPTVQSPNSTPKSPLNFKSAPIATQTTPTTPENPAVAVPPTKSVAEPISTVAITTTSMPSPTKITTVQLKGEAPIMRRAADDKVTVANTNGPKQISVNHYERLIEELKCPGCAYPMKAPIYLCKTGHSVCEQCTRVLMMCPLCKEPFTNIRSLTVEALCSKAHFRCSNASGGCTVRLHLDLLGWHEKQCIYKPMKCFMGRVWGDCQWSGREAFWKDHLEQEHSNKVFTKDSVELIWNMGVKQKPLTGYYVFEVFDEMFNFYEVYDKERVLFTMTCTSTVKEKKHNFAFEVTMIHLDNEALAITQKFPVHSEYDSDILMEGTCVSMQLTDLAKFIDEDRLLHYRVRVLEVNSPRKSKMVRKSAPPNGMHPIDFQQTQIEGVNLKSVPADVIVTRKLDDVPFLDPTPATTPSMANGSVGAQSTSEDELDKIRRRYNHKLNAPKENDSGSETDAEFEAFIAKKWGTPQMHFNRKYLKTNSDGSSNDDAFSKNGDFRSNLDNKFQTDDRVSLSSTATSYKKKMTNTLRKSFRSMQKPFMDLKAFSKRSPDKKIEN